MRRVMKRLEERAREYAGGALFEFLRDTSIPARKRLAFAPAVAHFVMSFADLYADVLTDGPAQNQYQQLVNTHTSEDENHWKWFLADLGQMGFDPKLEYSDALRFVWGKHTRRMRLLSYHMCRLGLGVDPLQKLVLVHCIEAAGKVTVDNVAKVGREFAAETGAKLVYFGAHHSDTEAAHTLEGDDTRRELEAIELAPAQAAQFAAIVDEAFGYFSAFRDEMLEIAKNGPFLPDSRATSA